MLQTVAVIRTHTQTSAIVIQGELGFVSQATGHYLNQWWLSVPPHICVIRARWRSREAYTLTPTQLARYSIVTEVFFLTHWGWASYMCVCKLTKSLFQIMVCLLVGIEPLSEPVMLLFRTLGTNINEIVGEIHTFSFMKMRSKILSPKWRYFSCFGLNVVINACCDTGTRLLICLCR